MANDPYSFYVRTRPDGRPADGFYHRGTCKLLGEGWKSFANQASAAAWRKGGPQEKPRAICSSCKDLLPPPRPQSGNSGPSQEVTPRVPAGAKFFVHDKGLFYHSYRECENFKNEKATNVYGFLTEKEAIEMSVFRDKTLHQMEEPNRGPCFSIVQREPGETCFGHLKKR